MLIRESKLTSTICEYFIPRLLVINRIMLSLSGHVLGPTVLAVAAAGGGGQAAAGGGGRAAAAISSGPWFGTGEARGPWPGSGILPLASLTRTLVPGRAWVAAAGD